MSFSTFSGNSAPAGQGGAIINTDQLNTSAVLTLKATLLAGQTSGGNCYNDGGSTTSDGYNLSDDSSCTFLTATGDQNDSATTVAGLDPLGLQNNGGPTATIALIPGTPGVGSTAIDAVPAGACTDTSGNYVTTDQRGVNRPQGSTCDIGAYELEQVPTANVCPGGIGPAPCSQTIITLYTIPANSAISATAVTQGATGLDFTFDSIGCIGSAVQNCLVQTKFAPTAPGLRLGAAEIPGAATTLISGIGEAPAPAFTPGIINTVAGGGPVCATATDALGDGCPATAAILSEPNATVLDSAGNLYIADSSNQRIRKVDTSGNITTVAGNGTQGYDGDNIPASTAELNQPTGVAVDGAGNLYIADSGNYRVRKVDTSGNITTVAGTGTSGYNGDNIPASTAELTEPTDVVVDGAGNLYIADFAGQRIRKVDSSGTITTVAGNGTLGFIDNVAATSGEIANPYGLALDSAGNLYIADSYNCLIREVTAATGTITTVAGTTAGAGTFVNCGYSGDAGPATSAEITASYSVAVDSAGDIHIADFGNHRIRQVNGAGTINTVAGYGVGGSGGDNGPATSAQFSAAFGVTLDAAGNIYIADEINNNIRKVNVSTSALAFPSTDVGSSSTPQSVVVTNIGNAPLAFEGFGIPPNFGMPGPASGDCQGGTPLLPGTNCTVEAYFAPLSGPALTGALLVGDNALNVTGATQTVSLSGTGLANATGVIINTSPQGLLVSVDGATAVAAPVSASWTVATQHTIAVSPTQTPTTGTQYSFTGWSDGTTNASDTVTASASVPSYTASFSTAYQLTTGVSPAAGGSVMPVSGNYDSSGASVPLQATANPGYTFSSWTGSVVSASSNPTSITMNAPQSVTANFTSTNHAPAITCANHATFTLGVFNSFTVTATGSPIPTISETGGLPGGVTFVGHSNGTATLSGTPTTGGAFYITFTAKNGVSPNATESFTLTVSGPLASVSTSSINFGNVYLGSTVSQPVTIKNIGTTTLNITGVSLTSSSGEYSYSNACGSTLSVGKSCVVTVFFHPVSVTNPCTGMLYMKDNSPGSPQEVSLTASVIDPQASFTPSSGLSFGTHKEASSTTESVTLKNTGLTQLTISSIAITGTNPSDFSKTTTCGSSLAAGYSCSISVTFKPLAKGALSASVKVTDNAQSGSQTVALSGTGD